MRIMINGTEREVETSITVQNLLERLDYDRFFVAIAVNGDCVPRVDQERFIIVANDEIDIVSPQQGG